MNGSVIDLSRIRAETTYLSLELRKEGGRPASRYLKAYCNRVTFMTIDKALLILLQSVLYVITESLEERGRRKRSSHNKNMEFTIAGSAED